MTSARDSWLFCDLAFLSPVSSTPAVQMHACFPIQLFIWNHSPFSSRTPFPVLPTHQLMSCLLSKSASLLSCLHLELVVECLDQGGCLMFKEDDQRQKPSKLKMRTKTFFLSIQGANKKMSVAHNPPRVLIKHIHVGFGVQMRVDFLLVCVPFCFLVMPPHL